jgi:dethiobiotin synthetase
MRLKALAGLAEPPEELCGYAFAAPLAPLVAARLEEVELALPEVVVAVDRAVRRHELTLVEGAGGLLVPCGPRWTILDLAAALRFPLVVVARAGLGTVNHTLLTVDAARRRGLGVAGVVLDGEGDESAATNAELIESFGGTRVLGRLPRLEQVTTETLRAAAATIDVEALLAAA